ncbi:dihydrofolate reductase-like [Amphiura filiformis]|uniref:dihydrofolate reductase-like n=1 Tax=Amphiura filiformis TaxID=82378 RepID=UPI003B227ACC
MATLRQFNMICAADECLGIGKDQRLPWKLPSEFANFRHLVSLRKDKTKKNAAILGRKTFLLEGERQPEKSFCYIVISTTLKEKPPVASYMCRSVAEAIQLVSSPELAPEIENVWIWGGHGVYKEGMSLPQCHRIYLTRVYANFECDAFFPGIDTTNYKLVSDPNIPEDIQEENGIKYKFEIYERFQVG